MDGHSAAGATAASQPVEVDASAPAGAPADEVDGGHAAVLGMMIAKLRAYEPDVVDAIQKMATNFEQHVTLSWFGDLKEQWVLAGFRAKEAEEFCNSLSVRDTAHVSPRGPTVPWPRVPTPSHLGQLPRTMPPQSPCAH